MKRKGFTLVELVIVIAVIGILATVLVPTFGAVIDKANHSTDVQTAGNLTTLVAMYAVNNPIESEADLAAAINEGRGDPNFYANLKPKSAKQGYCFWYDYNEGTVIVATAKEVAEKAEERKNNPTAQVAADWTITMSAEPRTGKTFNGGMRELVDGFILMGSGGNNDLLELVKNLEGAANVAAYDKALQAINDADNAKAGIEKLKALANSTVIHNDNGAFAPAGEIKNVHIPQGTEKLSNDVFVNGVLSDVTIVLPVNTKVAGSSLGYLDDACTIKVKVPAEDLIKTIEPSATVATIVVANGDAYKQGTDVERDNDGNATKLINGFSNVITGETVGEEITDPAVLATLLRYYVLGNNGNGYVYVDTDAKVIYVSNDKVRGGVSEDFQVVAGSFFDHNYESTACGMFTWELTYADGSKETLANATKAITINSNVTHVKVSTMKLVYEYDVKVAKVESIALESIGGLKPTRSINYDGSTRSWALVTQIKLTDNIPLTSLTLDKTITEDSDVFSVTSDVDGSATLSIGNISGNSSSKITFTCSGVNSARMTLTLLDCNDAAFTVNDKAKTQTKYGFAFVVGNKGYDVTLGDLFAPNGVDSIEADVILSKDGLNEWKEFDADTKWNEVKLKDLPDYTSITSLQIKVKGGQYSVPVVIKVVSDAYNVASYEDWEDAPNSTDLVLINSFTIKEAKYTSSTNSNGNKIATFAGVDKTSKDIGNKTIYGNLKTITVEEGFLIYSYSYNYLINTAGGKIEYLVINGPDYGEEVAVDGGNAESKGTHIAAVYANGVTITDSFISGFRSPLSAKGGTIKVENTTLSRGNFANVNVDAATTFELKNVTTIQYEGKDGNIAAGFFFKYSAGTSKFRVNNLVQHNFVNETQVRSIAAQFLATMGKDVADALSGALITSSDISKMSVITHKDSDGSTVLYHAGMFLQGQGTANFLGMSAKITQKPSVEFLDNSGGNYVATTEVVKGIPIVKKAFGATIIGVNKDTCTSCSHTRYAIPADSDVTEYAKSLVNDFLASKIIK